MPTIAAEPLRAVVRAMCKAAGSTDIEADLVANNLVEANLTGHDSHGVGMLPWYFECAAAGSLKVNQHAEVVRDEGAMIVVDGHAGFGQVIGKEAFDIAIARAKEHGVCVLAIRNSFHLCRIGAWAEQCAAAGLVSTHHTNVIGHGALVAPFRGSDARYVTNPYTAVMPGTNNNPPVLLDFATSFVAAGKIRVARNKGELAPEGALIDHEGRPTRDPNVLFDEPKGALTSFGAHKGYGMALINELFAGVLSGGGTNRPDTNREPAATINCMLSVLIDPGRLVDSEFFNSETDAALAHVKASPPANPAEPVLVPGDPERLTKAKRGAEGISVDPETWSQIKLGAERFQLLGAEIDRIAGLS
jgi:hydroxycarboxylate dehydrogenase B